MTKPQQKSTDNLDAYKREKKIFDGSAEIQSHAASDAYRDGWERIWGKKEPKR